MLATYTRPGCNHHAFHGQHIGTCAACQRAARSAAQAATLRSEAARRESHPVTDARAALRDWTPVLSL